MVLETERETSLPIRSALWPLGILGFLASYVLILSMSKKHKKSKSLNPQHGFTKPIQPQPATHQQGAQRQGESVLVPNVPPAPTNTNNSDQGSEKNIGGWKITKWKITKRILQIVGF